MPLTRARLRALQCAHDVDGMQQRERTQQRIGHHAVVELHRQLILEKIPPQRRLEEQPRSVRDESAVDQRPGVVDQPGIEPGDQRAEIDLHEHQHDQQRQRRCGCARGIARRRRARGSMPQRGPDQRGEDHARQRQMNRQPILRHARCARRGRTPPSTSRPRPAARRARRSPTAAPACRARSSRATGTRGTAAGTPTPTSAAEEPVRPFPPVDRLELAQAHAEVALRVLRDGLVLLELGLPRRLATAAAARRSTGRHSVIDRPDSVSRVAPPTSTRANTSAATISEPDDGSRR